ncbi:MAG: hypothetical protein PHF18_09815 [Methanosarcina sp.]|nr:hypothetical protein [Methanosarcina sp.]MDD3247127.1 hypothetical protein [Methanosarcina sp.]MDD4247682.1 hypothetical protein [Methanosarcina sp.]
MTKTIVDSQKAGAAYGKPQANTPAPAIYAKKDAKYECKPSKGARK